MSSPGLPSAATVTLTNPGRSQAVTAIHNSLPQNKLWTVTILLLMVEVWPRPKFLEARRGPMQLKPGLWPTIRQLKKGPRKGNRGPVRGTAGPTSGTEGPVTGTGPFNLHKAPFNCTRLGQSKWVLSNGGLGYLSSIVHDCLQLYTFSDKNSFKKESKWPRKCTIARDCARVAESGLKPPFESPQLDFPEFLLRF